jgi:TolA-binding protein
MDPLRIMLSELNPQDMAAESFHLRMSRDMTPFEQETVRLALIKKFGAPSADVVAPATMDVRGVTVTHLEQQKGRLQELVAEAEAEASKMQAAEAEAQTQAEARFDDARQRAAAIDWGQS